MQNWIKIAIGTMLIASVGLMGATGLGTYNADNKEWKPETVNLALRQIAHNLYTLCDNHTERIEPVQQKDENTFSVRVDEYVDYEKLPEIIDAVMVDFGLPEKYSVLLKNCEEETVELGYTYIALSRNEVACREREHTLDCSIIELLIHEVKTEESIPWNYLMLTLLLGGIIALLFYSYISANDKHDKEESIKQQKEQANETPIKKDNTISIGKFSFDHNNQSLTSTDGTSTLTFRESKLLHYLSSNPNQVLSRDQIQANVWEDEGVIVGRSLDVFVSRLRKILKSDESIKIKSVHGVGYRFEM